MGDDELKICLDEVQEEADQNIDRPGRLRLDQDQQLAPCQQPQIVILLIQQHVIDREQDDVGRREARHLRVQGLKELETIFRLAEKTRKSIFEVGNMPRTPSHKNFPSGHSK